MRRSVLLLVFLAALSGVVQVASAQDSAPPPSQGVVEPFGQPVAAPATARTALNSVFLEVAGNTGSFYSLNYERFSGNWGLRGGVSFLPAILDHWTVVMGTFVGSYYLGEGAHKLQFGLGLTANYDIRSAQYFDTYHEPQTETGGIAATGVIGYRYLPSDGGLDFGVGWTPYVGFQPGVFGVLTPLWVYNLIGFLSIGVHVGYTF